MIYNILLYAHTANGVIYEKNMHKDLCGRGRERILFLNTLPWLLRCTRDCVCRPRLG